MIPVINRQNKFITEYDLEKGRLVNGTMKHRDGTVEKVQIYVPNDSIRNRKPSNKAKISKLDVIEAQVAYTAMMTDTLLEV